MDVIEREFCNMPPVYVQFGTGYIQHIPVIKKRARKQLIELQRHPVLQKVPIRLAPRDDYPRDMFTVHVLGKLVYRTTVRVFGTTALILCIREAIRKYREALIATEADWAGLDSDVEPLRPGMTR